MLYELTEEYLPDHFLYRDSEIQRIKTIFHQYRQFSYCTNIALLGLTGSGKTSIIKKIIQEEDNTIYVSVTEQPTVNKILRFLSEERLHSNGDLIQSLIKKLKQNPKILVFDEVGKISQKEVQGFYTILNTLFRATNIPIIIITNKFNFVSDMLDDAKLTLMFERIELKRYNANQLSDILKKRWEMIKEKIKIEIPDYAFEYISGKIVKEHFSSARIALRVLSKCIINNNFEIDFIGKCSEDVKDQDFINFVHSLSRTEKDCLETILSLIEEDNEEISVSKINSKMPTRPPLTPSRVSQIVSSFVEAGIVTTTMKNLGRGGGKYRIISIAHKEYKSKLLKLLNPWEEYYNEYI